MAIDVLNRQRLISIDNQRVARLADSTLAAVDEAGRALAVVFVRGLAMQSLNRKFRGRNETTDVLSFPVECDPRLADDESLRRRFGTEFLGDVVVSTDSAVRQAKEAKHSLKREIDELVMHGVLHLCGFDHETDGGEMNRLELKLRRELLDKV